MFLISILISFKLKGYLIPYYLVFGYMVFFLSEGFFIIEIIFILTTFGMYIGYTRYKQFKVNLKPKKM